MKFKDSVRAHELLDGKSGIEIGAAAHNPFNISGCKFVDYTDDMDTMFKKQEVDFCGVAQRVDFVAAAWDLPFEDASQDYVLTSHVLEHCWDVLGTLNEWLRVLRPGGIIYMVLPHPDRTVDKGRLSTSWVELRQRRMAPKTEFITNPNSHFSVWRPEDWLIVDRYLQVMLLFIEDPDDKVGNGFTVALRKISLVDNPVEPGDIYLAADGGAFGLVVTSTTSENSTDDVAVRAFTSGQLVASGHSIDKFKLTKVRYYLPDYYPSWVPDEAIALSEELKNSA